MKLHMSITPPTAVAPVPPDFELTDDYVCAVMGVCDELLAETDCRFRMGGFGKSEWGVDTLDMSTVVESLPGAILDLRANREATIDLYEQGIERELTFTPEGDSVVIRCTSRTSWQPDPDVERAPREVVMSLLGGLVREFKVALQHGCPDFASAPPFRVLDEISE